MSVSGVTADHSASVAAGSYSSGKSSDSDLSMDDFFQLLSAQLQYQDPMQPTDNSQFMAQMAQFSLLEVAQNLEKSVNFSSASAAMGKDVQYITSDADGSAVQGEGTIAAVDLTGDSPEYLIDGSWIPQSNIIQFSTAADSGAAGTTDSTTK